MGKHYLSLAIQGFLFATCLLAASVAHAQGSRLRAVVGVQGALRTGDSSLYLYPNNATDKSIEVFSYTLTGSGASLRSKLINLYDATGHTYLIYDLDYNTSTMAFDTFSRTSRTFNPVGELTMSLIENRTSAGVYTLSSRSTYEFDASHRLLKCATERWRSSGSVWDTVNRTLYAFNAQGRETMHGTRNWNPTTHLLTSGDSVITHYDASGLIVTGDTTYKYSSSALEFQPAFRTSYNFTSAGVADSRNIDAWDAASQIWKPSARYISVYSSAGQLLSDTGYTWVSSSSSWKLSNVTVISYAPKSSVALTYRWDAVASMYNLSFRASFDTNSYNQVTREYYEDYNNGVWECNFGTVSYYELFDAAGVSSSPTPAPLISLAPNPCNTRLQVITQWETPQKCLATILDMAGKAVLSATCAAGHNSVAVIDVTSLPSGIYTLSLAGTKGAKATRSFLIRR